MDSAAAPVRLTSDAAEKASPMWSPSGKEVAFLRRSGPTLDLYIIPAGGGPKERVPGGRTTELEAAWSPDGTQLALSDSAQGKGSAIWLLDRRSGARRQLTAPTAAPGDRSPAFSPDGQWVAFVRMEGDRNSTDVYVIPARGGAARQVTAEHRMIRGMTWAMDARSILFSSNRAGFSRLWRVPATGSGPVEAVVAAGYNSVSPAVLRRRVGLYGSLH